MAERNQNQPSGVLTNSPNRLVGANFSKFYNLFIFTKIINVIFLSVREKKARKPQNALEATRHDA